MNTSRSPERLVFFSDAVVAIALTLLVLPLTELVSDLVAEHGSSVQVITEHQPQIYSFLLSFAVISRLWVSHHHVFEEVRAYNRLLMTLNLAWLLTIAVLPFPTEMIGAFGDDEFTVLFYIGTVLVNSALLTSMVFVVRSDQEVAESPHSISDRRLANAVGTTGSLVVALVLAALVPSVSYWPLLLLFIPPLIARRWSDRPQQAETG